METYEVIIVGAGPAGAFLNLLLARFGIPASSRLIIDSSPTPVIKGHADGFVARTIEVLKSLDLADELLAHGERAYHRREWKSRSEEKGIERCAAPGMAPLLGKLSGASRFDWTILTSHQGWLMRTLEKDLDKYSPGDEVERGSTLTDLRIDTGEDADYPVLATISSQIGKARTVMAKYLVGADGAHSFVRRSLGIKMVGSSVDDLYGVVDMVTDTDFPDIRKLCNVSDQDGTMLIIPREQMDSGEWLTRYYVPISKSVASPEYGQANAVLSEEQAEKEESVAARKTKISPESIIGRIAQMMKPYRLAKKEGTEIDWWTAYQVGQRLAEKVAEKDQQGKYRAFLIGDACHTHSPKAGQGMNVSMADALDLSWKLAHILLGLSPDPQALLDTFVGDRYTNAELLIHMDKAWYASMYVRRLQPTSTSDTPPPPEVMGPEMLNFIRGLNITYDAGYLVDEKTSFEPDGVIMSSNFSRGVLREGMRIADNVVMRYADANPVHLHDAVTTIDGKFRVLIFASSTFNDSRRSSWAAEKRLLLEIAPRYPDGSAKIYIVFPGNESDYLDVDWSLFPPSVKQQMEMDVFLGHPEQVYGFYGVNPSRGAIVVVRPDQVVGSIAALDDTVKVKGYLDRVLVHSTELTNKGDAGRFG